MKSRSDEVMKQQMTLSLLHFLASRLAHYAIGGSIRAPRLCGLDCVGFASQ